jgi:hypothetical protein
MCGCDKSKKKTCGKKKFKVRECGGRKEVKKYKRFVLTKEYPKKITHYKTDRSVASWSESSSSDSSSSSSDSSSSSSSSSSCHRGKRWGRNHW